MSSQQEDSVSNADKWSTASERYQERIGWTTIYGTSRIVELVNTFYPFTDTSYVLDVGTGGGSIPIKIRERAPAGTKILATDISPGMLAQVDKLKLPNVVTQQEDAVTLGGLDSDVFSHVFTSFAIQFTPDTPETVRQLYRVLRPGGMAGIVIWGDYAGPLDIHDRACRLVKPDYKPADPNTRGAWTSIREHQAQLQSAGFKNVGTDCCLMPFHCESGEQFCEYWFGYNNPVPGKLLKAAEEQGIDMEQLRTVMAKLVDEEFEGGKGVYFTAVLGWGSK